MTNTLTTWAVSACSELSDSSTSLQSWTIKNFEFSLEQTADSLWIVVNMPKGCKINFRLMYAPGNPIEAKSVKTDGFSTAITAYSDLGIHNIDVTLDPAPDYPILKYSAKLTPKQDLTFPYSPRDILVTAKNSRANVSGKIHATQEGTRSGFTFFSISGSGSAFYFQNLTALNPYFEQTETSGGNVVGGLWPELGFSLPTSTEKPIKAGTSITLSDAIIAFDAEEPKQEAEVTKLYLNLLATVYQQIPKPVTQYNDWPTVLEKGLKDLIESPGCWSLVAGHQYYNAYVSDYETPPEIMVQLAVLLPLVDYSEWSGRELDMIQVIKDGLPSFYNGELKTIMRWLPAAEDQLKGDEEQKVPMVMDSWYLHHPLLNLSRLAIKGDKETKALFLDSIDFAIKVAQQFDYKWPVFYKMDTLEVLKAETAEGAGGEKDVAGLYAHVMLQAWEITKEKKFLDEAEKAAQSLEGYGFDIFYQANDTAFAAGALLRLYKITKKELYLDLSNLCMAALFRNTQLWDCNYGYAKNFPTFFALFPLNNAPYTAVYEEQEVFCALHDYLKHAEGVDILPSVKLLVAEYVRYVVYRAVYYYAPMLPAEMLEEKPTVGEIDPKLWIALEDLHDGWEKSGSVGQEVYGAGNAFGIMPRHYFKIPDQEFMIYLDYPLTDFVLKKKSASFKILGSEQLSCRMMVIKTSRDKLPKINIEINNQVPNNELTKISGGNLETQLPGNSEIKVSW